MMKIDKNYLRELILEYLEEASKEEFLNSLAYGTLKLLKMSSVDDPDVQSNLRKLLMNSLTIKKVEELLRKYAGEFKTSEEEIRALLDSLRVNENMKISKETLKQLIRESLQEITDLEAVGAEEAYGDEDGEEQAHVRDMLKKEQESYIEKIDLLLRDVAVLESSFAQTHPGNDEISNILKDIRDNLDLLQGKLV